MAAADDGSPDERAAAQKSSAAQKRNRNSAYLSEFAKKVRLRATRAKRHVKPNLYCLKAAASKAKVKVLQKPDADKLCNPGEANSAEVLCIGSPTQKNVEMYKKVADENLLICRSLDRSPQEVDCEAPKPAHVVASEEENEDFRAVASELDASPDVNWDVTNGKLEAKPSSELLKSPENALVANLAMPGDGDSVGQTTVLHSANGVRNTDDLCSNLSTMPNKRQEITYSRRNRKEGFKLGKGSSRARSLSICVQGGSIMSDASKLNMKSGTALETRLSDDNPGFSHDGGSDGDSEHASGRCGGRIRKPILERVANTAGNEIGRYDRGGREPFGGLEYSGSEAIEGREGEKIVRNSWSVGCFSPGTLGSHGQFTDQVPSVLCDAEGNVWHIGKRAEESRSVEDVYLPGPPKARFKERRSVTLDQLQHSQELSPRELPADSFAPYSHLVPIEWRWSERADVNNESTNRMVVAKERSVFVGCIPDGIESLEEILYDLMDRFLERFDFAPVNFGQIEMIKAVKDFAFIELMSDKVAQIVLAANQLDVFEWGVNGFHFNIQGCTSTCTSVRPSVEYLPLRPARVLFVGNIPESQWHRSELVEFFSNLLQSSDPPMVSNYVVDVFLLPDSSDAYVEVASEVMADALIFKCSKNPDLLREIGDDVFICRDTCSVPLMSRHDGAISPQSSLVIAVPSGGEELKINNVVKVFLDVLPYIARKNNHVGYLEFVLIKPGKDHAFFQFNSEAFVDAIMDEYIESTQIFLCRGSPASYIILRPPEYSRPGARYRLGSYCKGMKVKLPGLKAYGTEMDRQRRSQIAAEQSNSITYVPRKFGDEPVKRPDFVVSVGTSRPPLATWNGLTSSGSAAVDPDCMIVVKGLPRGLSFKLARGALNELFERVLCDTGLLEAGRLVVTYLDRDGHLDVASLPDADLVYAILSVESTFVVAGEEIKLFPYERKSFNRRSDSADLSGGFCELSSLSDEDSPRKMLARKYDMEAIGAPGFQQQQTRGFTDWEEQSVLYHDSSMQGPPGRQKSNFNNLDNKQGYECGRNGSYKSKQSYRGYSKEKLQVWHGANDRSQTWDAPDFPGHQRMRQPENTKCQGNNPRSRIAYGQRGTLNNVTDFTSNEVDGLRFADTHSAMNDRFRVVSREGRTSQQGVEPNVHEFGGSVGVGAQFMRKRKFSAVGGVGGSMHGVGFSQKMSRSQFS